ncbi:DUF2087 domain-containing protein, partial [Mycobacterium tuberculosis]|nr:DUF2087 domain-containing protein [Mycobacterium tuberculosis]
MDDRYNITAEESQAILKKYFPEGTDGPLKTFKLRETQRVVVLRQIATRFEEDRTYTEKEVNEILKAVYDDYVAVRRYL